MKNEKRNEKGREVYNNPNDALESPKIINKLLNRIHNSCTITFKYKMMQGNKKGYNRKKEGPIDFQELHISGGRRDEG